MDELYALVARLAQARSPPAAVRPEALGLRPGDLGGLRAAAADCGIPLIADDDGVRLARPLELLDSDLIRDALSPRARARLAGLEIRSNVGSTNDVLLEQVPRGLASGAVCLTEFQSGGRGRQGRRWQSPFGINFLGSVHWAFPGPASLEGLSLAVGVAVAGALRGLGVRGVRLKWPNDALVRDAKIAGILVETRRSPAGAWSAVVGMGVNLGAPQDGSPPAGSSRMSGIVDQPWTDVASELRRPVGRNRAASALLSALLEALDLFEAKGFEAFRDEWGDLDLMRGADVELQVAGRPLRGEARGVDADGSLLVEVDGEVRRFASAEVSLRRVPGS